MMTDYYIVFVIGKDRRTSCVVITEDRDEAFKAAKDMPEGKPIHIRGELVAE